MYGSRPTSALRAVYVGEAVGVFSCPSCQESQRTGLTSCRARNTGPKPVIEISSAGNVRASANHDCQHCTPQAQHVWWRQGCFDRFLSLAVLCLDLNLQKPAATDNGRRRPCEGVQRMQAAQVALRRKPGLLSAVLKVSQI